VTTKVHGKKEQANLTTSSFGKRSFNFVGEVKSEFKKINWTGKEELQVYTKVVVLATIAFGMLVFLADLAIKNTLEAINTILRVFSA
jgi:preprotein translocase subunit SecE